jgi:ribosomal protein RSM22 (predicted rRNA methylase)
LQDAISGFCSAARAPDLAQRAAAQSTCYRGGGGSLSTVSDQDDVADVTARLPATYAATHAAPAPAPRIIAPVVNRKARARFRLCTENGISDVDIPRRDSAEYRRHRRRDWGELF